MRERRRTDGKLAPHPEVERVHNRVYATRCEARRDLFEYSEGFYKSRQLHSATGCPSPGEMERIAA